MKGFFILSSAIFWLLSNPFSAKMESKESIVYIKRNLEQSVKQQLSRNKSILLLGPRQVGKTTLLKQFKTDLTISLALPRIRQRYEKDPSLLYDEIATLKTDTKNIPRVVIDEVQKVPELMDCAQSIIDENMAQLILTGSSARKLKKHSNLLPGRVVKLSMDPLNISEYNKTSLQNLLIYGSLPGIITVANKTDRQTDLSSYVETYLEEEIRAEAAVRQVGHFARFLEYAGVESGELVSFRALSQEIGISHTTISSYYEILEDCLVAERIDPLTKSLTRKKLTKSSKYYLFDMGIKRLCAHAGPQLNVGNIGKFFEHFIGLELIRLTRHSTPQTFVRFWRDANGPEVDFVLEKNNTYHPIEVKWTDSPRSKDARHLNVFLEEYKQAQKGYIVCRTPRRLKINQNIDALPWQELPKLLANIY